VQPPQFENLMDNGWLNPWPKGVYLTMPSVVPPCNTETYLSHEDFEGGGFSSPTQRRLSNVRNSFALHYPNTPHQTPMAYFNDYNNAGFCYPTSSAPAFEDVDAYPFLRRTPATEEANFPVHHALDDRWGMARRPEPMIGSPTSYSDPRYNFLVDRCPTRGPPEPAATLYATQASCYSQPSYSGHYWPEVGQQTQPYPSGFFSRDDPFTSTTALEASTIGPALSDGEYFVS